jgi:hypothetical protein
MTLTLATPQLAVHDDVLAPADFERLLAHVEGERFVDVHHGGLKSVWRPEDGAPLCRARPYLWPPEPLSDFLPGEAARRGLREHADLCPTRTPIDAVFAAARDGAVAHPEIVGDAEAWLAMIARLYAYPAGAALSWHDDAEIYSGAFIFYAHPAWSPRWGGELLVADPATARATAGARREPRAAPGGAPDAYDDALLARGLGQFVMPRPNRLVLLAGGQPHTLARVSAAAGDRRRVSIAGFFLTPVAFAELALELHPGPGQ